MISARLSVNILYYRSAVCRLSCLCTRSFWTKQDFVIRFHHTETTQNKQYFVTTPIFYVNAAPHIGHLYTAALADSLARWKALLGYNVTFSTGTDEHGLKIQQAASRMNRSPPDHCDELSNTFKDVFSSSSIQYTDFIRTTELRHQTAVHHFWRELSSRGHIYRGSYKGWYSMSDEAFLGPNDITEVTGNDGLTIKVSAESGQPVEWMEEDNYMFRLSAFSSDLKHWLNQDVVYPEKYADVVRIMIDSGLDDLSVSRDRQRLHWGIPVPDDPSQTIYVWLDALVNYLTVGGYPDPGYHWPADCQLVGKDIIRFHAIYWPAFLIAAGLEPPRKIFCHSHWLVDGVKMSKSRGNVVNPKECLQKYTADGLRYFLLREGVPHSDGNFVEERVVSVLNSELANTVGNLMNRCLSAKINPSRNFPTFDPELFQSRATETDRRMWSQLQQLPGEVEENFDSLNIHKVINSIMTQLRSTNIFLETHKPWELCKHQNEAPWLDSVIYVTLETMRVCGILLQPVVPSLATNILDKLNVEPGRSRQFFACLQRYPGGIQLLDSGTGNIFPRIKV